MMVYSLGWRPNTLM